MTKRIGVLTSGGDCSGLNAVIRAVVRRGVGGYGWRVTGIRQGTLGLMTRPPDVEDLDFGVNDATILRLGGTILGTTNKGDPFAFPMSDGRPLDRSTEIVEGYRMLGLDALIGIGGDGSLHILRRLAQQGGMNLVGIPKTIDNDVAMTEDSIGYWTAVAVATEALDRLQPTAASHSRVMVLEVMGRDAGHIALAAGIAGGADIVLIPEIPWRLDKVKAQIDSLKTAGRNFALIVVAEAVRTEAGVHVTRGQGGAQRYGGIGHYVGETVAAATGAETRVTVLGHVQRGGQPVAPDRLLGSAFGVHAVDLVAAGKFDRMVAWSNRSVIDVPIADAIRQPHIVDRDGALVRTARGLGICLGD
ncbi:MAG: ATP-dependent 6-phosphofructokinase [Rhodospirillales bacterium]|nr:ATP-dependent 6-phosphofructokinase [Rhodospirillales bacterium]